MGDTSSETDSETSFQTASETSDESLFYRDYDWNELPAMTQEAAAKFGYTTAAQWTNQIDFGTDWEDLSDDLRTAAVVLGYTKETWCVDDDDASSSEELTDDVSLSGSEDMSNAPTNYATSVPTEEDSEENTYTDMSNEDWM